MAENKKVLFVVDNLVMGGVTKVLVNLVREIAGEGLSVDILALHRHEDMPMELPAGVRILSGGKRLASVDASMGGLLRNKDLWGILKKLLFAFKIKTGRIKGTVIKDRKEILSDDYDVEIAFGDGFPYIYTSCSPSPRKIAWMHSDVSVMDYSRRYRKLLKRLLAGYHQCVAVSEQVARAYEEIYALSKPCVIHNMMPVELIQKKALEAIPAYPSEGVNFVSVGRLDYSKNYPMLVETARKLKEKGYDFHLYLVGEGADREILQDLIRQGGLSERVFLLGAKENPYPYVKNAHCFLLSSRYEGLPTVILEALILGVPCVSTKVAGVEQMLENGYGLVCENDPEAFFHAVERLLNEPKLLKSFSENLADYTYDNQRLKK